MMNKARTVIVGMGAFGRELACWLMDAADAGQWPDTLAYIDDEPNRLQGLSYSLEYAGAIDAYAPQPGDRLLMAIGDPKNKARVAELLVQRGGVFATFRHPTAVVARTAVLGEGCILCPLSLVSADARLGRLVTVNALSSVGHDVVLGDHCTLSAHVDLTGGVQVGVGCFFGTGAKVVPRVRIGAGATIGAGALVMRSVREGDTVYCAPSKRL